ncbi:C-C chemokine receptor-like 2 isoform X1 [Eptesicus fuscus]|uniref:C-C chemokine receptor-like 2 isoform X1 n=2 Tax=Eptesicus fuscus TaxID=29078 RepID=UPI0024047DB6|nr:C-C chemokine receptor-like 2 isoform X1 [Eptesicus fuscus]
MPGVGSADAKEPLQRGHVGRRMLSLLQTFAPVLREKNSELPACHRKLPGGQPAMANYTDDDDDYDVIIYDPLPDNETLGKDGAQQCPPYDPAVLSAQLLPQLYTTVFLLGLLDIILMMCILVKCHRLRQVEHTYFLNLAVSNLCFLLTLPIQAHAASYGGPLGHPMCTVLVALSSVGLHSEALFNALLTLQSYLVCSRARRLSPAARRGACGALASGLAWLAAALLALPEVLLCAAPGDSRGSRCPCSGPHFLPGQGTAWEPILTLKVNLAGLLVPLLVFIVCLVRLGKTLRKSDLFRLVFVIMVVFLLMWGPYNVALFLSTFKDSFSLRDCGSRYHLDRSVQVTGIIASTHCCVNPLLYVLLDKAFQRRLCPCCCPLPPTEDPAQDTPWEECDHSTQL